MIPIGICTDFSTLPDAHALGFDFVEIPLSGLAALPDADFTDFAEFVAGNGIRVAACNAMLPEDLPIIGPSVAATALHGYLKHAFSRARRLGVGVVVLDAPGSRAVPAGFDFPFAWRQLGNFLRLAQGHAAECGLSVAMEPIRKAECSLLNLVSEATLIAGLLQLENVGVAANAGHMAMASEPLSALRRAAPLLRHVHVEHPLTRWMPRDGDGENYPRLMGALADCGYRGGVSVSAAAAGDFGPDAAAALACLRHAQGLSAPQATRP